MSAPTLQSNYREALKRLEGAAINYGQKPSGRALDQLTRAAKALRKCHDVLTEHNRKLKLKGEYV